MCQEMDECEDRVTVLEEKLEKLELMDKTELESKFEDIEYKIEEIETSISNSEDDFEGRTTDLEDTVNQLEERIDCLEEEGPGDDRWMKDIENLIGDVESTAEENKDAIKELQDKFENEIKTLKATMFTLMNFKNGLSDSKEEEK